MPIRMTGMVSQMDTESIIKELMAAQEMKLTKIDNKQTKLTWKMDKWKELNTKIYALYRDKLAPLRLQGTYNTKKVKSSNESKVIATADTNATNGSHSLQIKQLASSQFLTGAELTTDKNGNQVNTSTKLTDLGIENGTQFTITSGIEGEDNFVKKTLDVNEDTTLNDFMNICKSAGLNASYDENQKRLYISSKETGSKSKFSIVAGTSFATQDLRDIKEGVGYNDLSSEQKSKVNQYLQIVGRDLDTEYADGKLTDDEFTTLTEKKADAEQNLIEMAVERQKSLFSKEILSNYEAEFRAAQSDHAVTGTVANQFFTELEDKFKEENQPLVDSGEMTQAEYNTKLTELKNSEQTQKDLEAAMKKGVNEYINEKKTIQDGAIKSDYQDKLDQKIAQESAPGGAIDTAIMDMQNSIVQYQANLKLDGGTGSNTASKPGALDSLGIGAQGGTIAAQDAEFTYNGMEMTSSTNKVKANGLTFELTGTTANYGTANAETITLTVENDVDAVYDKVKDFIKSYNELLEEMNDLYYADSAKGYEPLTDEEKQAMSDDQIKLWEDKIKDSLLRRDDTLGTLTSSMRASLSRAVKVGEKQISLSNYGIMTSTDWTEKGKLHIYGDQEDPVYAEKKDKLKKALEEDPDTVVAALSSIFKGLYDEMTDKMKSTNLSSALTFYNDKEMTRLNERYAKEYKDMEKRLKNIEDRYYKQFSAMEVALSKLNSQSSSLAGLIGNNNK